MSDHQSLYRFYDADGVLLYVGITNRLTTRLQQHDESKHWWTEVADVKVEHYEDRLSVREAERHAIESEAPLYNIVHNRGRANVVRDRRPQINVPQFSFESLRTGTERVDALALHWELDGTAMSDDYHGWEISAFDLFDNWFDKYAKPRLDYPMRIWWFVGGPKTKIEYANLTPDDPPDKSHWCRYYTLPREHPSGEQVAIGDLPVSDYRWTTTRYDKGGFLQEATGWKPYGLQGWIAPSELGRMMRRQYRARRSASQVGA